MKLFDLRRGCGLWIFLPMLVVFVNLANVTIVALISGVFTELKTLQPKTYFAANGTLSYLDIAIDLFIGPALETVVLVILPVLVARKIAPRRVRFASGTLVAGVTAGLLHGLSNPVWGVMAFFSFCGYAAAYQYVKTERSRITAFSNSLLTHSLQNSLSVFFSIFLAKI